MKIQISISGEIVEGGVYASVKPTGTCVMKYRMLLDVVHPIEPIREKLHCTVLYSRNKTGATGHTESKNAYAAQFKEFIWWPGHDKKGYLVAVLESPDLRKANRDWHELGYSEEFDTYTPHITIRKNISKVQAEKAADILTLEYFRNPFMLTFGPQTVEALRD